MQTNKLKPERLATFAQRMQSSLHVVRDLERQYPGINKRFADIFGRFEHEELKRLESGIQTPEVRRELIEKTHIWQQICKDHPQEAKWNKHRGRAARYLGILYKNDPEGFKAGKYDELPDETLNEERPGTNTGLNKG